MKEKKELIVIDSKKVIDFALAASAVFLCGYILGKAFGG